MIAKSLTTLRSLYAFEKPQYFQKISNKEVVKIMRHTALKKRVSQNRF